MALVWWGAESGGNSTRLSAQELLSACGGDLCSALPWLALLSADFSYNALTALDSSLVSEPQEGLWETGERQAWALRVEGQLAAWGRLIFCFPSLSPLSVSYQLFAS